MADSEEKHNDSGGTYFGGAPGAAQNFSRDWEAAEKIADEMEAGISSKKEDNAALARGGIDALKEKGGPKEEPKEPKEPKEEEKEEAKTESEGKTESKEEDTEADKKRNELEAKTAPTPKEWAAFRAQKRKFNQDLQRREQEFQARLSEEAEKLRQREAQLSAIRTVDSLKESLANGDYDTLAESLGYKDWNELVGESVNVVSTPAYKEVRALKRREKEREEAQRKQADEWQKQELQRRQQAAEQQREQARAQHVEQIKTDLSANDDKTIATLAARDAFFVQAVFAEQEREWDGYETISTQEAADRVLALAKKQYELLREAFGDQPAAKAEDESQPNQRGSKTAAKQTKEIPRSQAKEAKAPEKELSDTEWFNLAKKQMEQAAAEDRMNGL